MSEPMPAMTDVELLAALGDQVEADHPCEFCGAPGAPYLGEVTPFKLNPASPLTITFFACCERCAALATAGRWEDLGAGNPSYAELYDGYRAHFTGTITRRNDQAPPHTATGPDVL